MSPNNPEQAGGEEVFFPGLNPQLEKQISTAFARRTNYLENLDSEEINSIIGLVPGVEDTVKFNRGLMAHDELSVVDYSDVARRVEELWFAAQRKDK